MMTIIESNVMVNPLNDSQAYNRVDKDNKLKENKTTIEEKSTSTSVNLSSTSKQLMHLKETILNTPQLNQERINQIKNELKDGSYRMNSRDIARKMIADVEMA